MNTSPCSQVSIGKQSRASLGFPVAERQGYFPRNLLILLRDTEDHQLSTAPWPCVLLFDALQSRLIRRMLATHFHSQIFACRT